VEENMGQASQTHCKRGHEFTPESTIVSKYKSGKYKGQSRRTCRTCKETFDKEYYRDNLEELKAYRLNYHRTVSKKKNLEEKGWTEELFEVTLSEQGGKCGICGVTIKQFGTRGEITALACADHEHSDPPKPRGLLCTFCNVGLGYFIDNPERLRSAAVYVEKFKI
jgi:hypothetical protein